MLEKFHLNNAVVVISGASSGIGKACAVACAEAGATVAALGRNKERLDLLYEQLHQISDRAHVVIPIDLNKMDAIPSAVEKITALCGKISGFVHCAGIGGEMPLRILREKDYLDYYNIHFVAGMELIRCISGKKAISPDGGSIVLFSSVSAKFGEPGTLAYASAKGAILAANKTLAAELGRKKIRVNTLIPGQVMGTGMSAIAEGQLSQEQFADLEKKHILGLGKPEYLTGAVVFLLSAASSWITGSELVIDGGFSL